MSDCSITVTGSWKGVVTLPITATVTALVDAVRTHGGLGLGTTLLVLAGGKTVAHSQPLSALSPAY